MRKWIKRIAAALLALLIIVAAYPFVIGDMETQVLDAAARASMPDRSFVRLPDGYTHYEWGGPGNGPVVVLVHGAATPFFIWDYQFEALVKAGFHVLRYDIFGRGLSDRPGAYNFELYDRQLLELLDSQNVKTQVDLVGVSLGGAIAIQFIDRHPERIRRFALFAPGGFPVKFPLIVRIITFPLLGEWIMRGFGDQILYPTMARQIRNPERSQEYMQKLSPLMKYKGFKQAMLATLRDKSLDSLKPVYERVGRSGKPGMLFWGTDDRSVPFEFHALVQAAIPSIEFHAVEGGGHSMNFESPEAVNPLLVEFFER